MGLGTQLRLAREAAPEIGEEGGGCGGAQLPVAPEASRGAGAEGGGCGGAQLPVAREAAPGAGVEGGGCGGAQLPVAREAAPGAGKEGGGCGGCFSSGAWETGPFLRFLDPGLEDRFLMARRKELLRSSKLMVGGGLCVVCGTIIFTVLQFLVWRDISFHDDHVKASLAVRASLAAILMFHWFTMWCRSMFQLELLNAAVMILTMDGLVLCAPYTLSSLMQVAQDADTYASDSGGLLIIQGIFLGSSLGLTMRWLTLLPLALNSVLLYASLVFIVGSPEPMANGCSNLAILLCLVIAALRRDRAEELKERQAFSTSRPPNSLEDVFERHCEHPFEPAAPPNIEASFESAGSANIFDPIYRKGANLTEQLQHIKDMGFAEHWLVNETAVKLLKTNMLGSGGFGQVFKGVFCNMMVAVKVPFDKLEESSSGRLPALCNELRVLRYLRHPNIVAFHGAIVKPVQLQISLVLELVHGQVLHNFLLSPEQAGEPSPIARYQIMLGTCRALSFMHTRQPHLVHGDIKSTNILVEVSGGNANPKLLDFGLSRVITRETRRLGGTLLWMAPEVYEGQGPVNCSADTYSFGRLLFFVATSLLPLKKMSAQKLRQALQSRRVPLPKWPDGCVFQPTCKDLVSACLRGSQAERPGMSEVFQCLIRLPQELRWDHSDNRFLQEVDILAAAAQRASEASEPSEELAAEPQAPLHVEDPLQPEFGPKNRLPPLPEDQTFHEGSESADAPARSLGQRSASRSSGSRSSGALRRRPRGEPWPLPLRPETSEAALQETLIQAVQRWNCARPIDACCGWHANIQAGNKALMGLLRQACPTSAPSRVRVQCDSCGILDLPPGMPCDVCGMEIDTDTDTGSELSRLDTL